MQEKLLHILKDSIKYSFKAFIERLLNQNVEHKFQFF